MYRYVGNAPTDFVDPTGLVVAPTIYIRINGKVPLPPNFNEQAVQTALQKILNKAGILAKVVINVTNIPFPDDDRGPVKGVPGHGNSPYGWHQQVEIIDDKSRVKEKIAYTGDRTYTTINTAAVRNRITDYRDKFHKDPNYPIMYGDVLAHEVLHLGVLGRSDDRSKSAIGTLPSSDSSGSIPIGITAKERDEINKLIGIK